MVVEEAVESGFLSSTVLVVLLTIASSLTAVHFWQLSRRDRKLGDLLPGPPPIPIIGNAHYFWSNTSHEIFTKAMNVSHNYGNVVRGYVGHKVVVGLTDPRDVEIILGSNSHIDKSDEYRFFKDWLGNGLLISTGEKWKTHRKLIAPAFHMNVLKSFIPTFNDNSRYTVGKLSKLVGKEFDVHDQMSETTVDILLETAMGSKRTSENEEGFHYAMAVMK